LRGEVEVFDAPWCGEVREPEPARVTSSFGGVDLDAQQLLEERGVRLFRFRRRIQRCGERLSRRREVQVCEMASELLIDRVAGHHAPAVASIMRW
jgi:hypothetical protein